MKVIKKLKLELLYDPARLLYRPKNQHMTTEIPTHIFIDVLFIMDRKSKKAMK